MAEEAVSTEEVVVEEFSPAEAKARKAGWSPLDTWRGDEADWVDYKEFNLRGELMGRINEQSGIINHLQSKVTDREKAINDMAALQTQISEREYKKALKDLQMEKKAALEEQDYDGVIDIDDQITELKTMKPVPVEEAPAAEEQGVPQEIVDWLSKPEQSWYHTNSTLRGMAEGIAGIIQSENPNISPADLCKQVNQKIRTEVPQYFKDSPSVDAGGEFSGNSQTRGKGGAPGWNSLTSEQKAVAERFERVGAMTKKEYIKSLVELGELE